MGYAVVMEETITEAGSLPSHWSTQWAKLYALIQALQLSKVRRQTFTQTPGMLLPHDRALYKERGLLTASEKDSKNKEEIKTLLDVAWKPERVAVIHC